jgi:hypothetical protein
MNAVPADERTIGNLTEANACAVPRTVEILALAGVNLTLPSTKTRVSIGSPPEAVKGRRLSNDFRTTAPLA